LFASALRDAMGARGLTGRALAALAGVREQTVSEWRHGAYRPEGGDLVTLAGVLQVPPETLRQDDTALAGTALAGTATASATASGTLDADPVAQLVREGQAEQAAWVLEFAAKILEAGARRLRQANADMNAERAHVAAAERAHLAQQATPPAAARPARTAAPTRRRGTGT
jgi:transcriptional regulator with XRE-family HTH domain